MQVFNNLKKSYSCHFVKLLDPEVIEYQQDLFLYSGNLLQIRSVRFHHSELEKEFGGVVILFSEPLHASLVTKG